MALTGPRASPQVIEEARNAYLRVYNDPQASIRDWVSSREDYLCLLMPPLDEWKTELGALIESVPADRGAIICGLLSEAKFFLQNSRGDASMLVLWIKTRAAASASTVELMAVEGVIARNIDLLSDEEKAEVWEAARQRSTELLA